MVEKRDRRIIRITFAEIVTKFHKISNDTWHIRDEIPPTTRQNRIPEWPLPLLTRGRKGERLEDSFRLFTELIPVSQLIVGESSIWPMLTRCYEIRLRIRGRLRDSMKNEYSVLFISMIVTVDIVILFDYLLSFLLFLFSFPFLILRHKSNLPMWIEDSSVVVLTNKSFVRSLLLKVDDED